MTTEDLIQAFFDAGRHAFIKTTSKKSSEVRKLLRHESVEIEGNEYTCLQELVVVKTAEHIRNLIPDCNIEVELDGNDSTLYVTLSDEEKRKLTTELYSFLSDNKCLGE